MTDRLCKFPDRETGIEIGQALGLFPGDVVPTYANGIWIDEIGIHKYNIGTDDEPEMITVDGWWVMLRAPEGFPVPPEINQFVVERDISNPEIPSRVWL